MKFFEIHVHIHQHEPTPFELIHKLQLLNCSVSESIDSLTRALEIEGAQPNQKECPLMSSDLQSVIDNLTSNFAALKDLLDQAEAALTAVPQRIADAVAAAQGAGATPEQLAALSELANTITTETQELSTAINTAAGQVTQ